MPTLLRRIVVKNVGVLKAFETLRAPQLERLTSFYARNGRGKTTLSAILRSAGMNDPAPILGRRTLGREGVNPEVILIYENAAVRFKNDRWQESIGRIDVFDGDFISDNLYAGESVELTHDRSLFTIILGKAGVKLAKHHEFFVAAAKRSGQRLKEAEAALNGDLPSDLSREEFLAFAGGPKLDGQIEQAEKYLKGVLQADRLAKLKKLQSLAVPTPEPNIKETLARTMAHIEASARGHLADHFRKFELTKQGESWIKYGIEHIRDDSCPFCGRADVDETGLVTIYNQIFGEDYKRHLDGILEVSDRTEKSLGPDARTALATIASENSEAVANWSEFYALGDAHLPVLNRALEDIAMAYQELRTLFDAKRQSPLVAIQHGEALERAMDSVNRAAQALKAYNEAVVKLDTLIGTKKLGMTLTEAQAIERLSNLKKRKRRSDAGVQSRIAAVLSARRSDNRAKRIRSIVQTRLKQKNEQAADHYHKRVNYYVEQFGAKFQISPITNVMTGNIGSVDYGLVIRGHKVARGRGRGKRDEPTFMNTLSTGDKTTLAFAFFLADLDRLHSDELKERIVVFDDPLSSYDTQRRAKTVDILFDLCSRCSQVIVLSHDAYFLRLVHRRCNQLPRVSYEIELDGPEDWSIAKEADLNQLCESEHARRLRKLRLYHELRHGDPSAIGPAIRTVLETHYRSAYPAYFEGDTDLGKIVRRIKDHGASHPCWKDCQDLDSCNVSTVDQHHGDDPNVRPKAPIDPDELHRLVRTCLLLVHDIQP